MRTKLALVLLCGCSGGSTAELDAPLVTPIVTLDAPLPDARPRPDSPVATCGPCPAGYHCGTANGLSVCRSDTSGIPLFDHVYVIVMENLSFSELGVAANVASSPFLHGLMTTAAYGTNYHGVTHPSLPNYLALTSGSDHGVGCDCDPIGAQSCGGLSCDLAFHDCACPQDASHIGDQLEARGRTWRAYAESMGAPCNLVTAGAYATRHVPFLYYDDMQADLARCRSHVVDYSQFVARAVDFAFIAPNLTDDMHDPITSHTPNIANGDTWLAQTGVPAITGLAGGGLLVIVWDEDDYSGLFADDDPIPIFLVSPYAKHGYASSIRADHYALLATLEDGLDLPRLGNAAAATPLGDYFPDD